MACGSSSSLPEFPNTGHRSCWQNSTYMSTVTTEHGMEYQKEVAFHIWLQLVSQGCRVYALYYELKDCHKFDDIGVHFESNGQEYAIYVQTKHHIKRNDRFDIKKHITSLLDGKIQKSMPMLDGKFIKYIFLTTVDRPIEYLEEIHSNFQPYIGIFDRFMTAGATTFRLVGQNREVVENLVKNAQSNDLRLSADYILNNVVIIAHAAQLEALRMINNGIIRSFYPTIDNRHLICIVRNNFLDAINTFENTTGCVRKTLNQNDFLLQLSLLEYELEELSTQYWKNYTTGSNIKKDILDCARGLKPVSTIEDNRILQLIRGIQHIEANIFIVPYKRLNQNQKDLLTRFKKTTIIVLEYESVDSLLWNNPNLVFVEMMSTNSIQMEVNRIPNNSISKNIEIQDSKLTAREMLHNLKLQYGASVANAIVQKLQEKMEANQHAQRLGCVQFQDINDHYSREYKFVQRRSTDIYFNEEIISNFQKCVVLAEPNKGKSGAMKTIMAIYKMKNPTCWIEFINARSCSKIFAGYSKHKELSEDDARDFLLNHIIRYGDDKILDKFLLEEYLSLREKGWKEIPIFLIFNGFDRVSEYHEEPMVDLIRKLSRLGIKVFISAHFSDKDFLEKLSSFTFAELRDETDETDSSSSESCFDNEQGGDNMVTTAYTTSNTTATFFMTAPTYFVQTASATQLYFYPFRTS